MIDLLIDLMNISRVLRPITNNSNGNRSKFRLRTTFLALPRRFAREKRAVGGCWCLGMTHSILVVETVPGQLTKKVDHWSKGLHAHFAPSLVPGARVPG